MVLLSCQVYAVSPDNIPMPNAYNNTFVSDTANIIDEVEEKRLDDILTSHFEKTGNQIAIVTTPDTSNEGSPKSFAVKLFKLWELGDAQKDNGLLILLSISDRRIEFETGYGLEGVLPDVSQKRIQRDHMVPYFKKGDYQTGLLEGTYATLDKINEGQAAELAVTTPKPMPVSSATTTSVENPNPTGIGIIFIMMFVALGVVAVCAFVGIRVNRKNESETATPEIKPLSEPQVKRPKLLNMRICNYCRKPTEHSKLLSNDYNRSKLLSYCEKRMELLGVAKVDQYQCQKCRTINRGIGYKERLDICRKCDHRSKYTLLSSHTTFRNYIYTCIDAKDRTKSLSSTNLHGIPKDWPEKSAVTVDIMHCYHCDDIFQKTSGISIPKTKIKPKPTPAVVAASTYSSSSSSTKKDDDDDYGSGGGYSSRESSSSSSSYGSGSSWGSSSSDSFGGGSSGGGGAGSDW